MRNLGNESDTGARVCIDLGTALSKASLCLGDGLRPSESVAPLPLGAASHADHPLLTPSALYVDGGRIYFGPSAVARATEKEGSKQLPILSFKMFLSARDLEPMLAMKLSGLYDPTNTLRCGDAITLYLAYLDRLVRAAILSEPNLPASAINAPRRITSPLWRASEEIEAAIKRLVNAAGAVSSLLGNALDNSDGVEINAAQNALRQAFSAPAQSFGGVVFEAQSTAAAYGAFSASRAPLVLVIDMGAGTTDLAGYERDTDALQPRLIEIDRAGQWSTLAGDEIDNILIGLFLRKAGGGRKTQQALWNRLRLQTLALKRDLFANGKATFRSGRKKVVVRREELYRDTSFKVFCRALTKTFEQSLSAMAVKAKHANASSVAVLLAGGGANLPFVADLVKAAARTSLRGVRLEIQTFGANWALPYFHHPLAGAFPQMAISMGGALMAMRKESAPEHA